MKHSKRRNRKLIRELKRLQPFEIYSAVSQRRAVKAQNPKGDIKRKEYDHESETETY